MGCPVGKRNLSPSMQDTMKQRDLFCGTSKSVALRIWYEDVYPRLVRKSIHLLNAPTFFWLRIAGTFSMTRHSGAWPLLTASSMSLPTSQRRADLVPEPFSIPRWAPATERSWQLCVSTPPWM